MKARVLYEDKLHAHEAEVAEVAELARLEALLTGQRGRVEASRDALREA